MILFACSSPRTDEILVPKLEANFYTKALGRINSELKSDPDNQKLIDQKLYYCERLDWPVDCISTLDTYKSQNGMTNQLVEQYVAYYDRHDRYQLLIDIIEKWSQEYDLKKKFHQPLIEALVKSGAKDRAITELRSFMIDKNALQDFVYASEQFLLIRDTLMSAYYLGKVFQEDPTNEWMSEYGQLLIALNYEEQGFQVLEVLAQSESSDREFDLMLSRLYAAHFQYKKARNLIKPYIAEDTLSYLMADLFLKDQKWDSAIVVINKVIAEDSLNTKALWKKARMYENRGWLATSLTHFNSIVKIHPEDTITINRIGLIQRKIAYLQRKKFEESKIQIKEIEPIKINR